MSKMKVIIYSESVEKARIEEIAKLSTIPYSMGKANTSIGEKDGAILTLEDTMDVLKITKNCTQNEKLEIGMIPVEE